MTFEDADNLAEVLNETGCHRLDWLYYPSIHDGGGAGRISPNFGEWFVMRRPRGTAVLVSVYMDGSISKLERNIV